MRRGSWRPLLLFRLRTLDRCAETEATGPDFRQKGKSMWLREQIETIKQRDPAATSTLEVLLTYPGLHALIFHRASSALRKREMHVGARLVSHIGRFLTGIEIHPGAVVGRRLSIDHGLGVDSGETSNV